MSSQSATPPVQKERNTWTDVWIRMVECECDWERAHPGTTRAPVRQGVCLIHGPAESVLSSQGVRRSLGVRRC
ncbi:hypothetical protein CSUI_009478 [Cystoisospora suis]|uniref:Uncharacterized protein n=1 Tax=Cystoisospora suis TaxID=483139 RepID=A0A2C6KJW5_9APIC|nr:hypothetical protein CSUI_009478 [Cystoisospora suis]